MKKLLLTLIGGACFALPAMSTTFTYDHEGQSLRYTTLNDSEVSVQADGYFLAGNVIIPETVSYEGNDYTVTSIEEEGFIYCRSLISVTIGNSVTSIGNYAFYGCRNLTSVNISGSVTSIGNYVFSQCPNITEIQVEKENQNYSSIDGVLYATQDNSLFFYPTAKKGAFKIPDFVTSIALDAFRDCSGLTSVTMPNALSSIDDSAFMGCTALTSVTIPKAVIKIGNSAFAGCSALISITIPGSVTSIGARVFALCGALTEINVDGENQSYSAIDGVLFNKSNTYIICYPAGKTTESYVIPNTVTTIGTAAFFGCGNLTSVSIPNTVTVIGEQAFWDCYGLTSMTIPESVTELGDCAFFECSGLTSITIPNSITKIGLSSFNGCSGLTTVVIPNSVTSIGNLAFSECSKLTSLTISNSIESIGEYAFANCYDLTSIYYGAEEPVEANISIFSDIYDRATLYVPAVAVEKCYKIDPWAQFDNIVAYKFDDGIEGISADINITDPYEIFTISGQNAGNNLHTLTPGIYIVRQGSAVKKIAVQ